MIEFLLKETNTKPLIIHGAGKSKTVPGGVWDTLQSMFYTHINIFQKYPGLNSIDQNDITIVTWKGGKYLHQKTILETCAEYYDFPIVILKWPDRASFWEGCRTKLTSTLGAIEDGLIKTKYIMYLDVSDVILLDHPMVILNRYLDLFPEKIVFNAERNHYPKNEVIGKRCPRIDPLVKSRFDKVFNFDLLKTHTEFKYLNGGVAIGKTNDFKEFLEYATSPETQCGIDISPPITSQFILRIAQHDKREKVVLDDECKLFTCLYNGPVEGDNMGEGRPASEINMQDVEIKAG